MKIKIEKVPKRKSKSNKRKDHENRKGNEIANEYRKKNENTKRIENANSKKLIGRA
jgi:hypothetical protein